MAKTPVFFIATKYKKQPAHVEFYTHEGKSVSFDAVKKEKTKVGVSFYADTPKHKVKK